MYIPKQVIWITGCASGIGRYLATQLHQAGHHIIATDINMEGLQEAAKTYHWDTSKMLLACQDVRKAEDWRVILQNALDRWNRVEVLMNIAGVLKPTHIHTTAIEDIDFHIDINLKGVMIGTKILSEQMVEQGHGHIINMASLAGVVPVTGLDMYCASKFGVRGFTLAVAQELKPHNIQVSVICPDIVDTPMLDTQLHYPEAAVAFSGKRWLTVEEIGQVIIKRAFHKKQLEIAYPFERAITAKLVSFFPKIADMMLHKLIEKGLVKQRKTRDERFG